VQVTEPGVSTYRIFRFDLRNPENITLNNLTLRGGDVSGQSPNGGGAIYYYDDGDGSLTLTNCTIKDSKAQNGGGIYGWYPSLTLTNCTIQIMHPMMEGGIWMRDGTGSTFTSCTLTGNTAADDGGAIIVMTIS
jgi:predicted outer membrane repeat protein